MASIEQNKKKEHLENFLKRIRNKKTVKSQRIK